VTRPLSAADVFCPIALDIAISVASTHRRSCKLNRLVIMIYPNKSSKSVLCRQVVRTGNEWMGADLMPGSFHGEAGLALNSSLTAKCVEVLTFFNEKLRLRGYGSRL